MCPRLGGDYYAGIFSVIDLLLFIAYHQLIVIQRIFFLNRSYPPPVDDLPAWTHRSF